MDEPMSALGFRVMSLLFKIRDLQSPRERVLGEVGIRPGFSVLDYGCGPGSYILPLARLVGATGRIYALDIHPLAIEKVRSIAAKKRLANIEVIQSDCETGLPDASVDVALLYDIFHDLGDPGAVLGELHRVLKPDGILSLNDHHMKDDEIATGVTTGELYRLLRKGDRTHSFLKV
jgi:ubiquinone/menaquinone biosynthesis C-methylase UbiE